ncbi:porin [Vibrio breoganii]|uniref:porin n=1 Tax=Vibrio breoganii TaxID=553239 RepID=UPI000C82C6C9|nr:porin [Vibrio breoganii]PMG06587.1 porin [Vibrio breoganii]
MKKTLLALAVASVAATSVNAAPIYQGEDGNVDFYGQLRTELKFNENDDGDNKADLSSGSSRAGIKGQYAIADGVDVVGLVEIGLRDNSDVNVRQHQFGFATDRFGTIKFGKQWTTSDDVYGADYSYFYGGSALRYATLNGALHDSQIKYSLDTDFMWVKAGYGLNEDSENDDLYELFVGTSFGDLNLHAGAGYNRDRDHVVGTYKSEYQTEILDSDGNGTGVFRDNTVVNNVTADLSNTYAEFTAEYGIGDSLIGFTYYWAELENRGNNNKIEENGFSLAGIYQVMEKTALYAGYEYTTQEAKDFDLDEDGTLIYVGVEHKFNSWARIYGEYGYGDGTTLGFNNQGSDAQVDPTVADGENNFAIGARFYW